MQRKTDDYQEQSIELALKGLGADRDQGLTSAEARERLARFGPNAIEEREEPLGTGSSAASGDQSPG
jgi:hypothetical protein